MLADEHVIKVVMVCKKEAEEFAAQHSLDSSTDKVKDKEQWFLQIATNTVAVIKNFGFRFMWVEILWINSEWYFNFISMDSQKVDNNTSQKPIIQPEKERIQALLKNIQTKDIRQIFPTLRTLAYDVFIPWTSEQVCMCFSFVFCEFQAIPDCIILLKSSGK